MATIEFDKYSRKGAYHWDEYFGGLRRMNSYTRARYDIVCDCARAAGASAATRLLDFGCGDGALAGILHRRLGVQVTGVDTSAQGIELASRMFAERGMPGEFKLIGGYDTGLPDGSFDIAVCSEVIEHVPDPSALLAELRRVVVPGGHVVISTPIRFSEAPIDRMHVQEWFVDEFVALCRTAFGDPIRLIRSHPVFWYELVVHRRRWLSRAGRLAANVLTRLGHNPFLNADGSWRCYTTQVLVLAKPADSRPAWPQQ